MTLVLAQKGKVGPHRGLNTWTRFMEKKVSGSLAGAALDAPRLNRGSIIFLILLTQRISMVNRLSGEPSAHWSWWGKPGLRESLGFSLPLN